VLHHQLGVWVDAGLRAGLTTLGLIALPAGGGLVVAAGIAAAGAATRVVMRDRRTAPVAGAQDGPDRVDGPAASPLAHRTAA